MGTTFQYTSEIIEALKEAGLLETIQCTLPREPKIHKVRKMRDNRAN